MKVCYRIAVIIAATLLLVSCGSSQMSGNGKVVTKTRQISKFNEIKISGAYQVKIIQGAQASLKVTTDSNIEPFVMTEVEGDTLSIHNKSGVRFSTKKPVLVQVVVKQLTHISASGSNHIIATNLNGSNLEVDTNGAIQANLSGTVAKLDLQISGSGKIDASKLVSGDVKVRLTGSGQVMVNSTDKLDSKITGSGSIMYAGNPKNIDQSIVGSGTLQKLK